MSRFRILLPGGSIEMVEADHYEITHSGALALYKNREEEVATYGPKLVVAYGARAWLKLELDCP